MKIIKFLFTYLFFFYYLFILLINIKKILKSDMIFIQNVGGFGHSFIFQDLIRRNYKNALYIQYYQDFRHNKYLPRIFNLNNILINVGINLKIGKKKFYIGHIENRNFDSLKYVLKIFFFVLLKKNKYQFIQETYNQKFNYVGGSKLVNTYANLVEKNKKNYELKNFLKKEFDEFFENPKRKTICLYLRNRKSDYKETSIRNGGNFQDYKKTIDYLISKNFYILLVGEAVNIFRKSYLDINSKYLIDHKKIGVSKKYFEIASFLNCNFYLSEHGGPQFFALYKKKSLILNCFPYGQKLGNVKMVYKKLYDKEKKNFILDIPKDLELEQNIDENKYEIKNLNSNEIFYLTKELIN